jgi:hypothetical protein
MYFQVKERKVDDENKKNEEPVEDKPKKGDLVNAGGESIADEPEQDGPYKKPLIFEGGDFPTNDEELVPVNIIGRCSVCSTTGTIEYPNNRIPASQIDKLLMYKSVKCFCPRCRKDTEFLPIEVRKFNDIPMLNNIQNSFKKGHIR